MKNNIAWAMPLVSGLLLAEKVLDRHWHPPVERIKKEITVMNRLRLHVRPAAMFARVANQFHSKVVVAKDGVEVDGKSVTALISLAALKDAKLRVLVGRTDARSDKQNRATDSITFRGGRRK
jgi:phosphotransferase system HPr (HPr) family protein